MNFYRKPKWISKREKILRRDGYMCQECKRYGKRIEAKHVHHVIPLEWCLIFNPLFALAGVNLISLCKKCHDSMHDRRNDKLSTKGLKLVERVHGEYGVEWTQKYGQDA